jgi:hypothetical protein
METTFFNGGLPAQTTNDDNASQNAARCAGSGAQSESSEIRPSPSSRRQPESRLPAEFREHTQQE